MSIKAPAYLTFLMVFSFSIFSFSARAEPTANEVAPPELQEQQQLFQEIKQTEKELRATQRHLQALQKQVFDQSPELNQKRVDLQNRVLDKMSSGDYNARKEMDELNDIVIKYQLSGEKPPLKEIQKYQERQQMFGRKQQEAFLDPEIQQLSKDLQETMEAEVTKLDPANQQIFNQMKQQISKLQELRQKLQMMMSSHQ